MNQAELQQDLQRLATQFQSRVSQGGLDRADQTHAPLLDSMLQQALLYDSSILDIATGPDPVVNLLDMVVFAELNADTLQRYWLPSVWGEAGAFFDEAFSKLKEEVWPIARRILSTRQQQQLYLLIREWERKNPDQLRVEGLRLLSFAQVSGEAAAKRAEEVRGLLGGVRSATQAADQGLMLAERALFLSQRVPFLLRAHVRLGAREVAADTKVLLIDAERTSQQALTELTRRIDALMRGWIAHLGLAGAACSVLFFVCYSVARRLGASR